MTQYKFDVIVIGAGPAGAAAAGSLAGAGVSVALLEAGVYAGAENWSGCVYFAESLAEQDCFGPEAVLAAPYERRVSRRGTLIHNGLDVAGLELTDPGTFKNCYTVLRPVYDPYFAHLARIKGAVHIPETTVTSLIRRDGRVVGVQTSRGRLYAGVVFIAEGDASHLVRAEKLERMPEPHYLQGVKAVLSLKPEEIEKRFKLGPDEGCAYELLVRNGSIAGRTAKLNVGGFLYTNRDSLSLGYVVPLDNLKKNYRGDHDRLFEWLRGLPLIRELTEDATLSAYGTKIIRSGGWNERPVLVQDGLAVGGASTGLGVDLPFPNFTGPAAASGLFFARAVRNILQRDLAPDRKNLTREYLDPLCASVYCKNARYLSRWPRYFSGSKVLFGRTVDMACGTLHFLSNGNFTDAGRFLRSHILSFRGIRESLTDAIRMVGSLRLWKPVITSTLHPATVFSWCANLLRRSTRVQKLGIILRIGGKDIDATALPWPAGSLIRRLSPGLQQALEQVYANDDRPAEEKFSKALRFILRSLRLTDFVILPGFLAWLFLVALATAAWDAFRFYILKTPVEKLLAEPVMVYQEKQRSARALDAVKPATALDAKLATNTYRTGSRSHIRTLWPETIADEPGMSKAALWWICPARVYVYDAPLAGRGRVTVNYENCIKCESCWRSEPARVLWGRHTEHQLIYRPESGAVQTLLGALRVSSYHSSSVKRPLELADEKLWYLNDDILRSCRAAHNASVAFMDAVSSLPASADFGRKAWPLSIGRRLNEALRTFETALSNDSRHDLARLVQGVQENIEFRLSEGRLFHAFYSCRELLQMTSAWLEAREGRERSLGSVSSGLSYEEASRIFPDRVVKLWEEEPLPGEWAGTLWKFLSEHQDDPYETIRVLSSVSPALGLIAAHWFPTAGIPKTSGLKREPSICAVDAHRLEIVESNDSVHIKGSLPLTPLAASRTLLLLANGRGYIVPLSGNGVTITPTPAIGFRAAGFAGVSLDCVVQNDAMAVPAAAQAFDAMSYLAIALGAADYLCRRVKEHALGRIQFPGQMLDTEGRDGIAKLGAVKAMIARTEAWKRLLETLSDECSQSAIRNPQSEIEHDLLCSTIAAMAFSPEPGALGYDAGQVFGGFAYSEDDLLSRFYRDSALFRFLVPGHGAAEKLHELLGSRNAGAAFPSLGRIAGIRTEPLGKHGQQWAYLAEKCAGISREADARLSGQARALVIGTGILFTRIEKALALGVESEAGTASIEVLLGLAEDALNAAVLSAGRGGVPPDALFPFEPRGTAVVLKEDYESFCTASGAPHRSGGFLTSAFDRTPRFVPEIQLHDQRLRARWTELVAWFKTNCRDSRFEGLFIERYIEKIHNLPSEIIAAVKENQWLATYIPKSEDGLGWRKAEYYILNSAAGNFGDAGINLLIMASTSIGTTPILLGLEDELPRVREELAPLIQDVNRLGEISVRLEKLIRSFANPNPAWIRKEFETVMKLVDNRIRHTRVVKYLAANFLRAFYGAGIAGQRGDFNGFMSGIRRAGEFFARLAPDVHTALEELPRRERCHRLFLRYLGHGAISAFALTEPTAGSDSGGVKTTAKLRSSKLTPLADGRYAFRVDEQNEKSMRYLIDADKLEFLETGPAYRTPDDQLVQIRFDRYDYSADEGARYYMYDGKACEFHDIGQVRTSPSGHLYEYYSLTGAKMWITNGSVATQFCLFAQTQEGVTGFMVDRHSEGLKVGADERKMGQRGSPTNEISIDSVRVPREAVIGYEGHGQVNALETLNVGRCGLAIVSGALMHKLLEESRQNLPATPDRDRLLGEAAAILFGSESLAFYLVGLFDRPHESVRMESAIAKYACSEDIHELISLVEFAFGPEGQTEKFLIEKARRDARILTIYEGTNEVQRFLILKDLISLAPTWPVLAAPPEDSKAGELAEWKNRLRSHVLEAAGLLGDTAWADAMLQPALFPLAEMAGEILRLECIFFRIEWLEKQNGILAQSDAGYAPRLLEAGKRAAFRTEARLTMINEKFIHGWSQIRENINTPEVRAADAALDSYRAAPETGIRSMIPLRARLHVLSIMRPVADLSPVPRLSGGAISEIVWMNNSRDHAGVQQTLALKDRSGALVTVDVLFVGSAAHEHLLREFAAGADRLVRLNSDHASPATIAEAVAALELLKPYDLITVGWSCPDGEQGTGAFLAGILGRNHYRKAGLEVLQDGKGLEHIAPPAVISITAAADRALPELPIIVASLFADVLVLHPSDTIPLEPAPRFETPVPATAAAKTVTTAQDAATYLIDYAARARAAHAADYQGEPGRSGLAHGNAVWTILDPREQKGNASVIRAGRHIAASYGLPMHAIVPAPREQWPGLLGSAYENGANRAYCLDTGNGMLSPEGKRELMRVIMNTAKAPIVLADSYWDEAFCLVAGEHVVAGRRVRVFSNLIMIDSEEQPGSFLIPAYDGKLNRREPLGKNPAFFTVASDAEFGATEKQNDFAATILDFPLSAEWIMPLPPPSLPTLLQAEVIIDLGYGIKDRSGFELAQELRKKLEALGLFPFFGATRKVTQDLRLLPVEYQIGQTGVRVNPKLIIALGISGAPQHIDYIGTRAEVLCFNKDPEAPLMKLNQDRQAPRVHPIVGDLFVTVPDLIARLS